MIGLAGHTSNKHGLTAGDPTTIRMSDEGYPSSQRVLVLPPGSPVSPAHRYTSLVACLDAYFVESSKINQACMGRTIYPAARHDGGTYMCFARI
jgi:hypothetical protein